MINTKKSGCTKAIILIFILVNTFLEVTTIAVNAADFNIESTNLQIYRDGLVRVTQIITVNETVPVITLPLLNSSASNFIVLDENQRVLDYNQTEINLKIFTLGTRNVSIQYDTNSLTQKDFEVWSFIIDIEYNLSVILPEESTIIYMNQIPISIDTVDSKITLNLFSGSWEISYIFSSIH